MAEVCFGLWLRSLNFTFSVVIDLVNADYSWQFRDDGGDILKKVWQMDRQTGRRGRSLLSCLLQLKTASLTWCWAWPGPWQVGGAVDPEGSLTWCWTWPGPWQVGGAVDPEGSLTWCWTWPGPWQVGGAVDPEGSLTWCWAWPGPWQVGGAVDSVTYMMLDMAWPLAGRRSCRAWRNKNMVRLFKQHR